MGDAFSIILRPAIGFVIIFLKARHEELIVWRINECYSPKTCKVSWNRLRVLHISIIINQSANT